MIRNSFGELISAIDTFKLCRKPLTLFFQGRVVAFRRMYVRIYVRMCACYLTRDRRIVEHGSSLLNLSVPQQGNFPRNTC